jgi:hypothetical protein
MLRSAVTAITFASLLGFGASRSMTEQEDPGQTLDAAFGALARRDWPALSTLIHPVALARLRQESLGLLILMTEERNAGKQGGGYNPQDVVISDHLSKVGSERVPQFTNAPAIAELAALPPADFVARWCEAVCGGDAQKDPVREVVALQRRIVGEVQESDTLAYVLYRLESRHLEMGELITDLPGRVMLMPLQRAGARWQLLLNDDIGWTINFMEVLNPRPPVPPSQLKRTTHVAPVGPTPLSPPVSRGRRRPAEEARAAFAAFERREWKTFVTFVHPERLASFQRQELAYLVAWVNSKEARAKASGEGFVAFVLQYDDSLPLEAIAQAAADSKVPAFPGSPTFAELARLSAPQFFVRWCEAAYDVDPSKGPGREQARLPA